MERPPSLNGLELIRTLEIMGLTLIHKVGPYCVFLDQLHGERVVCVTEGWDLPTGDIERLLQDNGLDVERFWQCYETLFQN